MNSEVLHSFKYLMEFLPNRYGVFHRIFSKMEKLVSGPTGNASVSFRRLGKLAFKQEPAGKVRVFAMVECWTQWLLSPLHDFVFHLLSKLPSDGTHDQFKPVDRLLKNGHVRF